MKFFVLVLVILPFSVLAQSKFALIDKNLEQPVIYTDSVTVEQVIKGYFPIENKSVDSLIANLIYLREMLSKMQRAKMESFELRASNAVITTIRIPYAYGDRYDAVAQTNNGQVQAKLNLLTSKDSNKDNMKRIKKLLAYLESNQSFYRAPNEIAPKLYNVVVITHKR
ncbi:MAG TPA: hypothetical protein VFR58_00935 [Flavisolibacter sp.]|nr:hypothetical protein [Flavisolibacter sp.]